MKCIKCGKKLHKMNYHYIPFKSRDGFRLCLKCSKIEKIITLV